METVNPFEKIETEVNHLAKTAKELITALELVRDFLMEDQPNRALRVTLTALEGGDLRIFTNKK